MMAAGLSGAGDGVLRVLPGERACTCPVIILILKTRTYLEYVLYKGEETLTSLDEWYESTLLEECVSSQQCLQV